MGGCHDIIVRDWLLADVINPQLLFNWKKKIEGNRFLAYCYKAAPNRWGMSSEKVKKTFFISAQLQPVWKTNCSPSAATEWTRERSTERQSWINEKTETWKTFPDERNRHGHAGKYQTQTACVTVSTRCCCPPLLIFHHLFIISALNESEGKKQQFCDGGCHKPRLLLSLSQIINRTKNETLKTFTTQTHKSLFHFSNCFVTLNLRDG